MDIADDLFIAIENQKMGKITEAQKFFDENMYEYNKEMVFVTKHIDFLMSIGDYETILRRYGHLNLDQILKAKEYINIINTRDYKRISELISVSGNSPTVLKAAVRDAFSKSNMKVADGYIKKGALMFDSDMDFVKLQAQYFCLVGEYNSGINLLRDLGMRDVSNDLSFLINKFDTIKKSYDVSSKLSDLKNLYHSVNTKSFSDYFTPSVYTHLMTNVLHEYVSLGVRHGYTNFTSMSKILYKAKNDEETRYLYIMSLINDGFPDKATKELEGRPFRNTQYASSIDNQLKKQKKEQEEKENRRRKEEEEEQERQMPRTERAGTDFLGYYKLLGISKDSKPKDVKKAYAKIVAKNAKKARTDDQKKEWEKQHATYNKALQILTTPKKKKIYDNGVDPDSPQAQYSRHHQQHRGFKGFENFGPFSDFFTDFGGRSGGFRQGRRTQYFFFQ